MKIFVCKNWIKLIVLVNCFFVSKIYCTQWNEVEKYEIILDQLANKLKEKIEDLNEDNYRNRHIKSIIRAINHTKDDKKRFKLIVQEFRAANQQRNKDEKDDHFLKVFSEILFSELNLQNFNSHLVNLISCANKISLPDNANQEQALQGVEAKMIELPILFNNIDENRTSVVQNPLTAGLQKLKGEVVSVPGVTLDSILQGGVPSVSFTLRDKGGKDIKVLRMGTPTIGSLSPKISDEFKKYIEVLRDKKEKHIYFNFQMHRGKIGERRRTGALLAFEGQNKDVLQIFSINKNNSFYKQKDGGDKKTLKELRDDFKDQMKNDNPDQNSLIFPQSWDEEKRNKYRSKFVEIFDSLAHNILGVSDDDAPMTQLQRQNLLELTYTFLTEYVTQEEAPYSINLTCKDAIDRGGEAKAMLYMMMVLKKICLSSSPLEGKEIEHYLNSIPGILFADAMQVRKRAITHERMEAFKNASMALINAGCEKIEGISSLFHLSSLDMQSIPHQRVTDPEVRKICKDERCQHAASTDGFEQLMKLISVLGGI